METTLSRLETIISTLATREDLTRLEAQISTLATRADLACLESRVQVALNSEINKQTWRIITLLAGLIPSMFAATVYVFKYL